VKKLTKITMIGAGICLLVLLAALIVAPKAINPNRFKPEIAAFLKNKSGRDINIEGDLQLAYAPKLAIKTGKIIMGDQSGFTGRPFATIEGSEIQVETMPLLSGNIVVNSVVLEGLTLNLTQDQQGRNNWIDLLGGTAQTAQPATSKQPEHIPQQTGNASRNALAGFALGALSIKKGQVVWENRQTGKTLHINALEFSSDGIAQDKPAGLALTAEISGNQFSYPGNVKAAADVLINDSLNNILINNSKLEWAGKRLPLEQPLTVAATIKKMAINAKEQALNVSSLQLQSGDIKIAADFNGEQILDKPVVKGQLQVEPFDLGAALQQWGLQRPAMADAKALSSFAMTSSFDFAPEKLDLANLDTVIDNSHGKGSFAINGFDAPAIVFDLTVDSLDLDRYLPPREHAEIASPGFAIAAGAAKLPLDWLIKLDANGKLTLGQLIVNGMTMQNAQLTVSAKNGGITIGQTAKPFYQGEYSGELALKTLAQSAQMTVKENLTNVQLEPYLQDIKGKAMVGGMLTASTSLQSTGANKKGLRDNLSGQVDFFLKDGFYSEFNLDKLVAQAKNAISGGGKAAEKELPNRTAFKAIKGTIAINQGQLTNNDLVVNAENFRSKGEGRAMLATGDLDYKLTTRVLKAKATADSPEQFHSKPVVIKVGGTLGNPDFTLDLSALLGDKTKAKVESLIDHNKDKIDKLMNKLDKKSGVNVKKLLKQIF